MSRKKTVKIIYDSVKVQIDKHFRSNVVFCLAMGFEDRPSWVSDLKRGRNLPSPEEAARMCVLLQTTPEEILVEEADIELVRSLIEREREKGIKKERPADGEALTPKDKALLTWFHSLPQEKREALLNLGGAPKGLF
jgi:hypothetical protein